MCHFRLLYFLPILLFGLVAPAQDTITVQCFTFDDITKRRDKYFFPTAGQDFRKVIMEYTLKCDPRTTADSYPCGEWDYLTYTYVHDPRGKWDSTLQTAPNYRIAGATPDSFPYTTSPVFEFWRTRQINAVRLTTTSLNVATPGQSTAMPMQVIDAGDRAMRSLFVYRASELTTAGLQAGNITGMRLNVTSMGSSVRHLTVKMAHTSQDTFGLIQLPTGMQTCYAHDADFLSTGIKDFQFAAPFVWNGSDAILVEISYHASSGAGVSIDVDTAAKKMGVVSAGIDYQLYFGSGQRQIQLGTGPVTTGAAPRTIELWARADVFNDAGLFRMGTSGTGKDFSLRTTATANNWRVQHWGTPDYDANIPNSAGVWHHYAVVYDGSRSYLVVDGLLHSSKAASLGTPVSNLILGRWEGSFLQGAINDVRVWNTALSATTLRNWMHRAPTSDHPNYSDLKAHYALDEGSGLSTGDYAGKQTVRGYLDGTPHWERVRGEDLKIGFSRVDFRPLIGFEQGIYTTRLDTTFSTDTLPAQAAQVVRYQNPDGAIQIPDNHPNHPSKPTDTLFCYQAGRYYYTYDAATGLKVDSHFVAASQTLRRQTKTWYSPNARFEIGRFITPYGINLTLGRDPNKGFTWYYDVTDYFPLLQDTVDISSGNNQELHDLKFHFIKGKPAAEVLGIKRIWGPSASYTYKNLAGDVSLPAVSVGLNPQTRFAKVKTRLTGHGHNSNDGNYPHCCEWKDNTHYLKVNGQNFGEWHIWRANACAENPVQPQGGTWPGAREGWCPGDVVPDFDFDITDKISGSAVQLDYDITPVPTNNLGMGNGNYVVAMHLVQYGAARNEVDAEVYEVINPNNTEYYTLRGKVCREPIVVLRNAGSKPLNSVKIKYGAVGGDKAVYQWTGNLAFGATAEITLPLKDAWIYSGNGTMHFEVSLYDPNGTADQNKENDRIRTTFEAPERYNHKIVLELRTNNFPTENTLTLKNEQNQTIHSIAPGSGDANRTWKDTLDLAAGCYTLEIMDSGNDGLQYWANSAAGSGSFKIWVLDANGNLLGLKNFKSDFGRKVLYSFTAKKGINDFVNPNPGADTLNNPATSVIHRDFEPVGLRVVPNPSGASAILKSTGLSGDVEIAIFTSNGTEVFKRRSTLTGADEISLKIEKPIPGIYFVRVTSQSGASQHLRWVVQGK
jgi:hypothetical protein